MEYLDFELRIAPGAGREYPVSVLRSPAGEASGTMRFPFDTLALQSSLQLLQIALLRSGGVRRDVLSDEQQYALGLTTISCVTPGFPQNCICDPQDPVRTDSAAPDRGAAQAR
jgi:hypothetical protein